MNDKQLQRSILDELEFDPSIETSTIGVAVEDGVVTLSGHVSRYVEKFAVENAARRVRGEKLPISNLSRMGELEMPQLGPPPIKSPRLGM